VALMRRARALDPHSMVISTNMFLVLSYLRRWPEARTVADDALASTPSSIPRIHLAAMSHLAEGDLPAAQRVLAAAPQDVDRAALSAYVAVYNDLYWILDDAAQRQVLTLGPEAFDGHLGTWGLVQAQIHSLRGDSAGARSYADSAQQSFGQGLLSAPDDPQARALYGLSLAYAGRKQDAIREGTAAATRLPMARDRFNGAYIEHLLVRTYILSDEPELALDHLERLLKNGYYLSPQWLSIDPAFAPLKGNPRFEKLISGAGILPT